MKKLVLTLVAVMMAGMMMAQDKAVKEPTGYQGFLEQGSAYRLADKGNTTVGFSTTHGFYFNGNTFIGVGFGIEGGDGFFAMPLYTAVKYNFGYTKQVTPTAQLRLGSYIGNAVGPYADLAVGFRFGSSRDFAINVMLTGTFYSPSKWTTHEGDDTYDSYQVIEHKMNPSSIGLRVGIEW